MITTTVYKGRLSTKPGARIVQLSAEEYERLCRLDEIEALDRRDTVRIGPDDIRRLMKSAGWTEVLPPAPVRKAWKSWFDWALLGVVAGLVLVAVFRSCS